jgi:hypothetical protein
MDEQQQRIVCQISLAVKSMPKVLSNMIAMYAYGMMSLYNAE